MYSLFAMILNHILVSTNSFKATPILWAKSFLDSGTLTPVLKKLEAEGVLDRINEKICIGQGYRGKTGKLGIGSCTTHFRNNLPGCPPTAEEMEQFLRSLD